VILTVSQELVAKLQQLALNSME